MPHPRVRTNWRVPGFSQCSRVFREKCSCFVPFFIDFNQNRSLSFCPSRFHPANPPFFHIFSRPGFDGPWKNASGRRCCFQFNCKSFWELIFSKFSQHIRDPPWTPLVYRSLQRNEVDTQRDVTPLRHPHCFHATCGKSYLRQSEGEDFELNVERKKNRTPHQSCPAHKRARKLPKNCLKKNNRLHFVCLPS